MKKANQILLVLFIAIFVLAPASWAQKPNQAKVVGITDGDTIKVLHDGKQVKIRLYGIDTPEKRQAFGNRAKRFTSDMVAGKTVKIIAMDTDLYGRTVALVLMPDDSVTLNEALVQSGYGWVYRKYCRADFCSDWLDYEREAHDSGKGLWKDSNPIPPWEFRRRK